MYNVEKTEREIGLCTAKIGGIFGLLVFGRGWCGYACWIAMILARVGNIEKIMFWAFIIRNLLYYAVGVGRGLDILN